MQTHSKGGPSSLVSIPNIWHPLSDLLPRFLITNSHAHSAVSMTFYGDNTFFFTICTISHCWKFTEQPQQAACYPPQRKNTLHLLHIFWGFSYPFGLWHFTDFFYVWESFFCLQNWLILEVGRILTLLPFYSFFIALWKHSGKLQQNYLFLAVFHIKRDIVLTLNKTLNSAISDKQWLLKPQNNFLFSPALENLLFRD